MFKDYYMINKFIHTLRNCVTCEGIDGVTKDDVAKYVLKLFTSEEYTAPVSGRDFLKSDDVSKILKSYCDSERVICSTLQNGTVVYFAEVSLNIAGGNSVGKSYVYLLNYAANKTYILILTDASIHIMPVENLADDGFNVADTDKTIGVLDNLGDTPISMVSAVNYSKLVSYHFKKDIAIDEITREPLYFILGITKGSVGSTQVTLMQILDEEDRPAIMVVNPFSEEHILDDLVVAYNPQSLIEVSSFNAKGNEIIIDGRFTIDAYPFNDIVIQESIKRTAKNIKNSKVVSSVVDVPRKIKDTITGLDSRLRKTIANIRKAKEDDLKEKALNNEFLPLLDDILSTTISVLTTYGVIAFGLLNPILGIALGVGLKLIMSKYHKGTREKVITLLENKLELIAEEIKDAESQGELDKKNKLIQFRQQLETKLAKLKVGKQLASN